MASKQVAAHLPGSLVSESTLLQLSVLFVGMEQRPFSIKLEKHRNFYLVTPLPSESIYLVG